MLKRSVLFVACIVLVFATGARAQGITSVGPARPVLGTVGSAPGIKGLPYSAETIVEKDQALADENHIHTETHGKIFRDAEGRTRQEMELRSPDGSQRVTVEIYDPIGKVYVQLEPESKTATLYGYSSFGIGTPVPAAASPAKTRPQPTAALSAPSNAATRTRSLSGVSAGISGAVTSEVEQLGTMVIEGLTVSGTRLTITRPAGAAGNSQPIVSSHETWFSNDQQIDVLTVLKHPQLGESTYKLVNIHVGDPDPLLFQIPADYTRVDRTH